MRAKRSLMVPAAAMGLVVALATASPAAPHQRPPIPEPTANPWRMRHWPQTQPWQRAQPPGRPHRHGAPSAIDPQNYELPETMTWDDYKAIPGTTWSDPSRKGSKIGRAHV